MLQLGVSLGGRVRVDVHTVDDALVVHEADGVAHVRQDGRRLVFPERAPFYYIIEELASR